MSRHVIDNRTASEGGRARNFLKIERLSADEAGHTAVRSLHQRHESRESAARLRNYLRIERGHTA